MAAKQKRIEAAKKRDKRSKIMLVILGVVLLAVAVIEIPSMLAVMNKKPPPGSTYDPGPSSVVPGSQALPNVSVGGTVSVTPAAAAAKGELVDTDLPPTTAAGQLVSFSVFDTKNPFRPQVTSSPAGSTSGTSTTPVANPTPTPGSTTTTPATTTPTTTTPTTTAPAGSATPTGVVPSSGGTSVPATTTTPAAPLLPTVTISVNGVSTNVSTNGTFPSGAPVFRLISYQSGSAQIGIVGGSYAAGGATLTLQVGHPVTLQNTTDGTQYRLELIKTP